jgi:hypothetical protein
MFWWVLLGYVVLSPVLGLLVGTAIRMRDQSDAPAATEAMSEPVPCPALLPGRESVAVAAAG